MSEISPLSPEQQTVNDINELCETYAVETFRSPDTVWCETHIPLQDSMGIIPIDGVTFRCVTSGGVTTGDGVTVSSIIFTMPGSTNSEGYSFNTSPYSDQVEPEVPITDPIKRAGFAATASFAVQYLRVLQATGKLVPPQR